MEEILELLKEYGKNHRLPNDLSYAIIINEDHSGLVSQSIDPFLDNADIEFYSIDELKEKLKE